MSNPVNLEEIVLKQQHEIDRLHAMSEIQQCMAHYETVHLNPAYIAKSIESFAMWRPDVSAEVSDWGCYFGPDAMKGFWESQTGDDLRGGIFFHTLCSPCIQVAGDGKTAKATWMSAGFETMPAGIMCPEAKSFWAWGKYGIDFIKHPEAGEWKIWHFKWFRTIRSDFYKDWYQDSIHTLSGQPGKGYEHPDRHASVFHKPYQFDEIPHPFPMDPEPYEHYDGNFRWIFGNEELEKQFGVKYPEEYRKLYNVGYPEVI
ncbi:MAG: hypothetical protein H6Q60_237 [Oscillospiraceae bacterium]|nr:hypothetical protein [Oscillospiraceae bacterium]